MSTSTPSRRKRGNYIPQLGGIGHQISKAKSKLYGYLSGYEPCCYTGAKKEIVLESFKQAFNDEVDLIENTTLTTSTPEFKKKIIGFVDSFLTKYYGRMSNIKNPEKVSELAEKSKKDLETLQKLLSKLISGSNDPLNGVALCPLNSAGGRSDLIIDLCDKCPNYMSHKFCLLFDYAMEEEISVELFNFFVPEYKHLALGLIAISSFYMRERNVEPSELIRFHMLYEHILAIGKLFECMNPDGEVRMKIVEDILSGYTKGKLDYDDPVYKKYEKVLESVFDDIIQGRKRYIREFSRALKKTRNELDSKYDPDKDLFASFHGTSQKARTGIAESLISSAFEVDFNKDNEIYQAFDRHIGYMSVYRASKLEDGVYYPVIAILINNPGKFKPRVIFIADNPTQDRCAYIHNRISAFLHELKNDCSIEQEKGRLFLKDATSEWYLEVDITERQGIYCFDFSNATDTLDHRFQWMVLNFMLGKEVADFWLYLCQCEKEFIMPDGTKRVFRQLTGSPQGLLGGYDIFALCHHFIFLMLMKICGLEDKSAIEFYRLLGDDSVFKTIISEVDIFNGKLTDDEGNPRSEIELEHINLCEKFTGFKVNYGKSEATHWNSKESKLDFAKVTYRNGKLFTPIPFRLIMNYSCGVESKLAVAIWRGERNDPDAESFMDVVLKQCDPVYDDIVKSGCVPFLTKFTDKSRNYSEMWLACLRYAIAINYLDMALSFSLLKDRDKIRVDADYDICNAALEKLIGKRIPDIDDIPYNHKIIRLWDNNYEIMQMLQKIYDADDIDEKFLSLAISPLGSEFLNGTFFDCLYNLGVIRKELLLAKKQGRKVSRDQEYPDFDMSMLKHLRKLSDCMIVRGITKKPRIEVSLLRGIITSLESVLSIMEETPVYKEIDAIQALL